MLQVNDVCTAVDISCSLVYGRVFVDYISNCKLCNDHTILQAMQVDGEMLRICSECIQSIKKKKCVMSGSVL